MASKRARAALKSEAHKLRMTSKGGRNIAANRCAFKLGRFVPDEISHDEIIEALIPAMHANGSVDDDGLEACRKTIESGLKAGFGVEPTQSKQPSTAIRIAVKKAHYPRKEDVSRVLRSLVPVTSDLDIVDLLSSRSFDPEKVRERRLAACLPIGANVPFWASEWQQQGYRLLVPVVDCAGSIRSFRAWRIKQTSSKQCKRKAPRGYSLKGLVMADRLGRFILRNGCWPQCNPNHPMVVIVEGEPDFLAWSIRSSMNVDDQKWATFGVVSGAWNQSIADRIPTQCNVMIGAHDDVAGDGYERAIKATLQHHNVMKMTLQKEDDHVLVRC